MIRNSLAAGGRLRAPVDELSDLKVRLLDVEGRTTVGRHTPESLEALNVQAAAIRSRIRRLERNRR